MLCGNCGHAQNSHVISPDAVYKDYIYETVSSPGLPRHFSDYARKTAKMVNPPAGSLAIDIGSNDGTLLKAFQKTGLRVLGVDPAIEIARQATSEGAETLPAFFSSRLAGRILKRHGKAAIITANNILANIDDLDDIFAGVGRLLAPDGVFVFESFYLPDLVEHMVFDFIYHEHISSFTVKPVRDYARKFGMELFHVEHVDTKGGSMRYYIKPSGSDRPVRKSVAAQVAFENRSGIHTPVPFLMLRKKIGRIKKQLVEQLIILNKENRVVAGYGASATSTTLIYHFKLQKLLTFLVDDYPRKHNTFSPGCHMPVLSKEAIAKMKPDAIVILAWRYAEAIIANNRAYLKNGGKFIVPLPEVKIVS